MPLGVLRSFAFDQVLLPCRVVLVEIIYFEKKIVDLLPVLFNLFVERFNAFLQFCITQHQLLHISHPIHGD